VGYQKTTKVFTKKCAKRIAVRHHDAMTSSANSKEKLNLLLFPLSLRIEEASAI
jgi:hypothetical protein